MRGTPARRLTLATQSYRTRKPFIIARGSKTSADQIIVTIEEDGHKGLGACVPYPRYDETLGSVSNDIKLIQSDIENGLTIEELQRIMKPGAARNAVDCALWDLHTKITCTPIWELAGLEKPTARITAATLSVASPDIVNMNARDLTDRPLLKLKLAGDELDFARIEAAMQGAPDAQFILDANEALDRETLTSLTRKIDLSRIALIEQPVPTNHDEQLTGNPNKNLLCADESFHTKEDIVRLSPYYGAINIKLDKTGGFSEALATAKQAREFGVTIMIGCMLGSSLAMAPAFILAGHADYLDLDGPLLLAEDDENGFEFSGSLMRPSKIWGMPNISS